MKEKIFAKIDELKDQMIQDICEMVQIDSQRSEPQEGMPFGQGVNNALTKALEISKREGLSVKNVDGYMGYAQFGEGENYIGVMGHLDVVEVGDGWIYPPFSATIADNILCVLWYACFKKIRHRTKYPDSCHLRYKRRNRYGRLPLLS